MTVKQEERIKNHIIKHHNKYTQGYTMSYKQFRRIANFVCPGLRHADPAIMSDALKYVAAQGKLNKILFKKGLKLTSSNYYTRWHVALDTPTEVAKMNKTSKIIRTAAATLRTGYAINRGNPLAEV